MSGDGDVMDSRAILAGLGLSGGGDDADSASEGVTMSYAESGADFDMDFGEEVEGEG